MTDDGRRLQLYGWVGSINIIDQLLGNNSYSLLHIVVITDLHPRAFG